MYEAFLAHHGVHQLKLGCCVARSNTKLLQHFKRENDLKSRIHSISAVAHDESHSQQAQEKFVGMIGELEFRLLDTLCRKKLA